MPLRLRPFLAAPLALAPALAAVPLVTATFAHAQSSPPPPAPTMAEATREHAACRALKGESAADAPICFRIWLGRYTAVASPAQIAIARRLAEAEPAPAAAPPKPAASTAHPEPLPSARPATPKPVASAAPPEPASRQTPPPARSQAKPPASAAPREPPVPETTQPATQPPREATPEKTPEKHASGHIAKASAADGTGTGTVLDLCALAPAKGGVTFVKQRVLMLAPAGLPGALQDGPAREAGGATLMTRVFLSRFPMKRFHNVVSSTPGAPAWAGKENLTLAEVQSALEEDEASAFLSYSAACADYLAVPIVNKVDISRKDVKVKDKKGRERTVEQLSIKASATLSLYRRTEAGFALHARLQASVPSAADMISDFGAQTMSSVEAQATGSLGPLGAELAVSVGRISSQGLHISALPEASCVLPAAGRDRLPGLAACSKQGIAPSWLASEGLDERFGAACKEAAKEPENKEKALVCELRVRAFQLSRALQKEARGVQGWSLFDVLLRGSQTDAQGLGIALGESEGVAVGHAFQVRSASGERLAFLKITEVGPGGEAGRQKRSSLELRAGEAPIGSRVEEYPMLGVALWAYGGAASLGWVYGQTTVQDRTVVRLPGTLVTGGLLGGYELSPHIGWSDTYLRAGGSIANAAGRGTKLTVFSIDALFEKGTYLDSRVSAFVGLGGSVVLGSVTLEETVVTRETKLSSTVFGPMGVLGLDLFLTPEVSLRLAVLARAPLTRATWAENESDEATDEKAVDTRPSALADWSRREDHLLTVQSTGGLAVMF